ncbi:proline racemase family protein [Telmatobacter bradus]|uniref:proline racemase family protein n=1 Tax=Telmatobacter bradus TaxID=474953 RepID=UPI003B437045
MEDSFVPASIAVIDSHTAGEPTRCVLGEFPELGSGSMAERVALLRQNYDYLRRAILCEPRGSDVLVGAFLLEPVDPTCAAGMIFFNNAGYLGMCGHGTIGVVKTLAYMGRIRAGVHRLETPVGEVEATLAADGAVTIHNVPAYCYRAAVPVEVPGYGVVTGDIAWGGNWFFLVPNHGKQLVIEHADSLSEFTRAIRKALEAQGITGEDGAEIDHVELFAAPSDAANHSRNFVMCPGNAYDRSPCGTGTSAKLACLAAAGKLAPGALWRQEGILGTVFEGYYELDPAQPGKILPRIRSTASVTAESRLIFEENDPFRLGVPACI